MELYGRQSGLSSNFQKNYDVGIGFAKEIFTKEVWVEISYVLKGIMAEAGMSFIVYYAIYILEAIILFALSSLFSFLFLYCCITLAAVITKKARIITAIAIYYAVNTATSFILQLLMMFGFQGIANRMASLEEALIAPTVAIMLLGAIALVGVICIMLYTLQYWMLDRKLNLS